MMYHYTSISAMHESLPNYIFASPIFYVTHLFHGKDGTCHMQLLILVLNKIECLEDILEQFAEEGIQGATVIDSRGMAQSLYNHDELKFIASLRLLLDPSHQENKTIFVVLPEDKISVVSRIVNDITGGLNNPDTGILFTVPVQHIEGIGGAK